MTIEAMKQALAVLEEIADAVFSPYDNQLGDAILALRAAIEQPRQWQGLTKREFLEAVDGLVDLEDCWVAIEAKLKEINA
jgi:hypothetical protein